MFVPVGGLYLGSAVYEMFDAGVANILGVDTLRHGTNVWNNLSIRIWGGQPSHGGKKSGSTEGFCKDNTNNFFYVFKDSELFQKPSFQIQEDLKRFSISRLYSIATSMYLRVFPRFHASFSGYNIVFYNLFSSFEGRLSETIKIIVSTISAIFNYIFSPTIRFRYSKIDESRFLNDPQYCDMAYRTQKSVEPWRIGLLGSLLTGVNLGWFSRAKSNPLKILTGAAQLTCAVGVSVLCINVVAATPALIAPIAVGALLA